MFTLLSNIVQIAKQRSRNTTKRRTSSFNTTHTNKDKDKDPRGFETNHPQLHHHSNNHYTSPLPSSVSSKFLSSSSSTKIEALSVFFDLFICRLVNFLDYSTPDACATCPHVKVSFPQTTSHSLHLSKVFAPNSPKNHSLLSSVLVTALRSLFLLIVM